jgi:hypothetical protein
MRTSDSYEPPPLVRKLVLAAFKITKPYERISLEAGFIRDCATPLRGWREIKVRPRALRLDEYRTRWQEVDDCLKERFQWAGRVVRDHTLSKGTDPEPFEIPPETRERVLENVFGDIFHSILHPHQAVRRWKYEQGRRADQEK